VFRRSITAVLLLLAAIGLTVLPAAAASAAPVNHCPLWANYVLHHPYPHCYANL
jgi:hypothetical protein